MERFRFTHPLALAAALSLVSTFACAGDIELEQALNAPAQRQLAAQRAEDALGSFINRASIEQTGSGNYATISQIGTSNVALISQTGNFMSATISQVGSGNYASITQRY